MEFRNLLYELSDGVATITLNRPEVRNALSGETWRELRQAIHLSGRDTSVRVVIITGAGDKAFAAGADIRGLQDRDAWEMLEAEAQQVLNELENLSKPVIAAVNGYALGGGCELAMACDVRIASERAFFGQPEVNLGILPSAGGTQRLPRLVGLGKAKELILSGEIIDAREAERIGLANRVVPPERLMQECRDLAGKISQRGPLAVAMAKAAINVGAATDFRTGLAYEAAAQALLFTTEDKQEGVRAFLEKRAPRWKGR